MPLIEAASSRSLTMLRLQRQILRSSCRPRTFPTQLRFTARKLSTVETDPEDYGEYSVILPEEPFIFGTSHIKPRTVPSKIIKPYYADNPEGEILHETPHKDTGKIKLGSSDEVKLREAALLAKNVRNFAETQVKVGVTTNAIDLAIHEFIVKHSAYPSPLLYQGFPRSCCTSVNNIVVHGIPDDRKLENGDIINIDITIFLNGFHGDTSQTFLVGNVDRSGRELVSITNEALERALSACGPGRPFKVIGKAIHQVISGKNYSISSQFTGHGIGKVFHSAPWIQHHLNDEPGIMEPGHCFTIEPAIIQGSNPRAWIFPDGWTASTENCARSAQAEHMVLITETGADVLTR